MAAIGIYTDYRNPLSFPSTTGGWDTNATCWGWSEPVYYQDCPDYKGQIETLVRRLRREAKAERNRVVIRGIARLQAARAADTIRERQRFVRVAGKRLTAAQRARLRRFA